MLLMKESVLSLKKKINTLVFLFSNWLQVLNKFYDLLNIIFDDLGI